MATTSASRRLPDAPCRLVLDEVYGFGMYQKAPDKHGHALRSSLPPGSVVDARHVQGNLRITGSDRAMLLFRTSYEGTVTIEGAGRPRRTASSASSPGWPLNRSRRCGSATIAPW